MNFVIIEKPTQLEIKDIQFDVKMLTQAIKGSHACHESHKPKLKLDLIDKQNRLDVLERYHKIWNKRAEYDQIKHLKRRDPETYNSHCKNLCKDIKGVNYLEKGQFFRIRRRFDGVQKDLGYVDTPQDALDILKLYI